ncbi:hypothetical protein BCEP4_610026 [Burkholderia cepacia]|nr:hypothetical protein BCEP4_610026 [Burkholderia cepacia]
MILVNTFGSRIGQFCAIGREDTFGFTNAIKKTIKIELMVRIKNPD